MVSKEREYQRRKYQKRRLEGRCLRCGKSAYSPILGENFKHCYSCLEQRRARYTVKQPRRTPKLFCKSMGICTTCRHAPVRGEPKKNGRPYVTCNRCLDNARRRHYERPSEP